MSSAHIKDIENHIYQHGWTIEKKEGNDLDVPEVWLLNKHRSRLLLIFDGMGDLDVLPVEQSYGCYIDGTPSVSLYFSKNNRQEWKKKLLEFMKKLDSF
jgi:hypothetical protein